MTSAPHNNLHLVVLLSGRGSNFQAILRAIEAGRVPARITAVISNQPQAAGLHMAESAGIATEVIDHQDYPDRAQYDQALQQAIDRYQPDLVVLAGFMRILTPDLVRHYVGRMVNIHPSLLPKYRGLHTHARVLEAGDHEHGASVHYVTEELDGGPVILQVKVPVLADDGPEQLAARVLEQEHRLYPEAVRLIAEGRVQWRPEGPYYDQHPLQEPVLLDAAPG